MNKVVGIDLGTTNSVVAAIEGGQPTVITNAEGFRTTPSIVAYTKKEELLVGQLAKRQSVVNAENTFFSVKRFIGCKADEVSEESKELPYKVIKDNNGNIKIKCSSLNKDFSPEEISAQIIRKLITDAKEYLGQDVTKAVITVPAYFNDSQRQATVDAGKIAGIEVLRIINEPTAASLAYGLDKKQNETILVFDLGGGTFDVSVLEVGDGIFEVLSTAGDTNLGGDDFDKALVRWLVEDFQAKEGTNLMKDIQALQRLTEAAEKAKMELSNVEKTTINLPFITADKTGPKHIQQDLTREKFEILCKDLIDRCRIPVEKALKDAKLDKSGINEVVLVGGSTRIPAIQQLVESLTGKKPNKSVNPDEVVAIGAAIQGAVLTGNITDVLLLDVTPLSLGIETMGGVFTKLIEANTTIPTRKSEVFSTASDNQPSVEIHVLQGERPMSRDNRSLGRFHLDGIMSAPRGVPKIECTIDIDANGVLSVTAKDQATGKENKIRIEGGSQLSKEEIERMKADAEANAESDRIEREKVDKLNQADNLIFQTEKQISEYSEKLTEEDKTELNEVLDELKSAHKEQELEKIDSTMTKMNEVWSKISTKLYQQASTEETPTPQTETAEDISFEEVK